MDEQAVKAQQAGDRFAKKAADDATMRITKKQADEEGLDTLRFKKNRLGLRKKESSR